jgi:hypothetical protein
VTLWEVFKIIGHREVKTRNKFPFSGRRRSRKPRRRELLVVWQGYREPEWIPEALLREDVQGKVKDYFLLIEERRRQAIGPSGKMDT